MRLGEFFMLAETRRLALKACCVWCQGRMVAFRYSGSAAEFRACWREMCMTAWVLDLAVVVIRFWPRMHSCVAWKIWLILIGCINVLRYSRYSLKPYLKDSSILKYLSNQLCMHLKSTQPNRIIKLLCFVNLLFLASISVKKYEFEFKFRLAHSCSLNSVLMHPFLLTLQLEIKRNVLKLIF